ncbi:ThiF family adenylyltransferase [Enterococcus sp. DIV0876]|uniref:ThiF family adenylyltransferase n=1 Tax=Enterococcus sp. DIV0876 TaxID=2774633 RepID=UPI003D301564
MDNKRYILNDTLLVFKNEQGLVLSLPEENSFVIDQNIDAFIFLLNQFFLPNSFEQAFENAIDNGIDFKDVEEETQCFLIKENLIKSFFVPKEIETSLTNKQLTKYDRQIRHFSSKNGQNFKTAIRMQESICQAHVMIIGVGGIGSYLSSGLALLGVKELTLIDFDNIELSNTSRQILYTENDLGKDKLSVAKQKLLDYNPELKINCYNINIKDETSLESVSTDGVSMLSLCADKPLLEIHYIIDSFCQKRNIPWIMGGPFSQGRVSLGPIIIPRKTASYTDMVKKSHIIDDDISRINSRRISAIIDSDNSLAAKMQEVEIIKYLTKYQEVSVLGKQFIIDTATWNIEEICLCD